MKLPLKLSFTLMVIENSNNMFTLVQS